MSATFTVTRKRPPPPPPDPNLPVKHIQFEFSFSYQSKDTPDYRVVEFFPEEGKYISLVCTSQAGWPPGIVKSIDCEQMREFIDALISMANDTFGRGEW